VNVRWNSNSLGKPEEVRRAIIKSARRISGAQTGSIGRRGFTQASYRAPEMTEAWEYLPGGTNARRAQLRLKLLWKALARENTQNPSQKVR